VKDVTIKDIYMTVILMGINVLMFLIPLIINGSITTELMIKLGAQYWPLIKEGEWWRLITCNFLHFSAQHLMCNLLVLFALGSIMEPCLGHVRFTVLYLLSGIGGSTLSYLVNMIRANSTVAAGASTAVYGLLGALACIIFFGYGDRVGIYVTKGKFVILVALNVLANVFGESNIDYYGHIGGFISGILVFIVMALIMKRRSEDV